jgi:mannose-6-phosphate isomerase-like protein (cupin superfamily)
MQAKITRPGEGRSIWVVGDRYTTLASGDETGGAYALIAAWVPPGGGPPLHLHHNEDEAFYVLEGDLVFEADGGRISAGPGAWVALPRGSRHRFQNVGPSPARMLVVVNPSGLERMFAEVGRDAKESSEDSGASMSEDIARLVAVAPRYGIEIFPPQ